jgi:hypothetical protein
MRDLLKLRVRMAGRFSRDLVRAEPLAGAAVLTLLAAGAWYGFGEARSEAGARDLATAAIGVCLLLHLSRRDARFLALAGRVPRGVFAIEYLILLLPAAAVLALGATPVLGMAVLLAGLVVAMLPSGQASRVWARWATHRPMPRLAPVSAFEWVSGLRRWLLPLGVLYLLAVPVSAVPAGPTALLLVSAWGICGFYTEWEGWPLVQGFGLGPGAFIRAKITRAVGLWVILSVPMVAVFLARHPTLWPVLLVSVIACGLVIAASVIAKYAAYREGRAMGAFGSLVPLLFTAMLLIPPVAAFLLLRLWRLATRNLDPYLHAFD